MYENNVPYTGGVSREPIHLFLVLNTSVSETGYISAVNTGIRNMLQSLHSNHGAPVHTTLIIGGETPQTSFVDIPIKAAYRQYSDVAGEVDADINQTFRELNVRLRKVCESTPLTNRPVILLIGNPQNSNCGKDLDDSLGELMENRYFRSAIKAAITLGSDGSETFLRFVDGETRNLFSVEEATQSQQQVLKVLIQTVAETCLRTSESNTGNSLYFDIEDSADAQENGENLCAFEDAFAMQLMFSAFTPFSECEAEEHPLGDDTYGWY